MSVETFVTYWSHFVTENFENVCLAHKTTRLMVSTPHQVPAGVFGNFESQPSLRNICFTCHPLSFVRLLANRSSECGLIGWIMYKKGNDIPHLHEILWQADLWFASVGTAWLHSHTWKCFCLVSTLLEWIFILIDAQWCIVHFIR